MQQTQLIRRKLRQIIVTAAALLFFATVPAMAYSTSQTYYKSTGGYYSTKYGWVGPKPSPQPIPVPRPTPTPTPTPTPIPTPTPTPVPSPPPATGSISAEEMQMVNLVNQERAKAGVAQLAVDSQLVAVARIKSQDMITNNYFGHTSPSFGATFNLIKQRGIPYSTAGENLAGTMNVTSAHQMLMNSAGHRANILYPAFRRIGIGIVHGGPYGAMFTQLFLG